MTLSAFIEETRAGEGPTVILVTDATSQRRVLTGMAAVRARTCLRELRAVFAQHQPQKDETDTVGAPHG